LFIRQQARKKQLSRIKSWTVVLVDYGTHFYKPTAKDAYRPKMGRLTYVHITSTVGYRSDPYELRSHGHEPKFDHTCISNLAGHGFTRRTCFLIQYSPLRTRIVPVVY